MSYQKEKPLVPFLHRCAWCKRRLNGQMDTVSFYWGYCVGESPKWYCSPECAKSRYQHNKFVEAERERLNAYIEQEEE